MNDNTTSSNEDSKLLFVADGDCVGGDGGGGTIMMPKKKQTPKNNDTTMMMTTPTTMYGASLLVIYLLLSVATVYTGYTIYGRTTSFTATIPQEEMMTTTDLLLLDSSIRNDPVVPSLAQFMVILVQDSIDLNLFVLIFIPSLICVPRKPSRWTANVMASAGCAKLGVMPKSNDI
eukprot:CAMPEP_0170896178 /NCGR_PEP_ID=MMETSP0734-20130129/44619_1 /TAXON_ID=186038 /ORGANISM="Fragilariopsis kerguelensis, Strain L26-C5" /LENGTH=174 /DNA_ID=CAMNT_0011288329 /DNA_START=82 /DNA_END=607 /DNA_ORIENTATION=+